MNESLSVAQRNLESAKNHRLNPTQTDLASKVNSFVEESSRGEGRRLTLKKFGQEGTITFGRTSKFAVSSYSTARTAA
jgi:hypothetical protein